ncbi:hypothetical protein [Haloferax sp. DFSO60]|uniref:transcriptional regulator FilR1 domain-containing protein n=1 Tax=Haloferax sp. DFSO60 TaxID=3388652 RepID=UPI00397B9B98
MSVQFVNYRSGGYEVTLVGQCALTMYNNCEKTLKGVMNARELLSMLPPDASIDPVFFAEASIYTSTPEIPDGVINQLFESVEVSGEMYGIAPVALAGQMKAFYDAATAGGTQVEMIIDESLFDNLLRSPDTRQVMVNSIRREKTNIHLTDIPYGYGLWATDDEAGIVVYTDTGVGGIALNDTPESIAWVRSEFDKLLENSTLATLASIGEE